MTKKIKSVFTMEMDGKERKLAVRMPTPAQQRKGDRIYSKQFKDILLAEEALLRQKLDSVMRKQNLWDDSKEEELKKVNDRITNGLKKLAEGGCKLAEARRTAIDVRVARAQKLALMTDRNQLDNMTAESQAENARFDYYVSVCTVYEDSEGAPVFNGTEDYAAKSEEPYAVRAARELMYLINDLDENFAAKYPENVFLKKYGFVDEKLRLIDPQTKQFVDVDGNRIDEVGYRLNDQGERVDAEGNKLDADGNPIVQFTPFLDDNDQPVAPVEAPAEVANG